ncbi:MAG: copper resistance protein NlpE [Clostridium sp.]|nr:copper resistance protein NlpE [Clostridium sp.]
MKKMIFMAATSAALLLGACSPKAGTAADTAKAPGYPAIYQGTVPAADAPGILYTVAVTPYSETEAVYSMRTDVPGNDAATTLDQGQVAISTGTPTDPNAVVFTLQSDNDSTAVTYFIATDSTLTMTGADFAPTALPYVLRRTL